MNEVILWDDLPAQLSWKEKIGYLCLMLADSPGRYVSPVEHSVGHGVYIRTMRLPAGLIFLGREHLKGHLVTLLEGSAIMITEHGKKRFDAVSNVLTSPGFHMVAYMLTDCVAQTAHWGIDETKTHQELEDEIFGPAEDLMALGRQVQAQLTAQVWDPQLLRFV